jgi:hypothetical protein
LAARKHGNTGIRGGIAVINQQLAFLRPKVPKSSPVSAIEVFPAPMSWRQEFTIFGDFTHRTSNIPYRIK